MRRSLILATVLLGAMTGWPWTARPAAAEYAHVAATAEFGPDGTGATSFSEQINTLAYQQATHRLYVIDAEPAGHIYGFDHPAPGIFTPLDDPFPIPFTFSDTGSDIAVDNTTSSTAGDLYVTPDGILPVKSFTSSGMPLPTAYESGYHELCGTAVDRGGHLWVSRYEPGAVIEFEPASSLPIGSVNTESTAYFPCKVAIDQSNNDLYVSSLGGAGVWQYTASSGYTAAKLIATGNYDSRLAVNGAKHVLYVSSYQGKIRAFSTVTGDLLETIEPPTPDIRGLAVDEATDTLFVSVAGNTDQILEMPGVQVPKVATGETIAEGVVSGTVDPDGTGPITECYFVFGPTTEYGSKQSCAQSLPITAPDTVSATLPGLARETTYHYRLVVGDGNPATVTRGADETLVIHNVSQLETEAPTNVGRTTAVLNAFFEGTNEATSYFFECWPGGLRFPSAPDEELAAPATGPVSISVPISGLTAGTTYHARVVARNSRGASVADPIEFTTRPSVSAVQTEAASELTKTGATLNGSYDGANNDLPPGPNEDVSYYFEWGPDQSYGHATAAPPGVDNGTHAGTVHVSAPIGGLETSLSSSLPYHYRLVAVTDAGTTYGQDMTFRTLPHDKPALANVRAEAVGPTTATIAADVSGGGIPASYRVEFGTTPRFGRTTPDLALQPGDIPVSVDVALDQLEPGTVYHYRLLATNDTGTTTGDEGTFATPNAPTLDLREVSASTGSAHLTFSVSSNSKPTEVRVEYGESASYGSTSAPVQVAPSLEEQTVGVDLTGLRAATDYHFRGVATNEIGVATGSDQTFSTQSAPIAAPPPSGESPVTPCKRAFVRRNGTCAPAKKKHARHRKHKKGKKHRRN